MPFGRRPMNVGLCFPIPVEAAAENGHSVQLADRATRCPLASPQIVGSDIEDEDATAVFEHRGTH